MDKWTIYISSAGTRIKIDNCDYQAEILLCNNEMLQSGIRCITDTLTGKFAEWKRVRGLNPGGRHISDTVNTHSASCPFLLNITIFLSASSWLWRKDRESRSVFHLYSNLLCRLWVWIPWRLREIKASQRLQPTLLRFKVSSHNKTHYYFIRFHSTSRRCS